MIIKIHTKHKIVSYYSEEMKDYFKIYLGTSKARDSNHNRCIYRIKDDEINIFTINHEIITIPSKPIRDIKKAIEENNIPKIMFDNYEGFRLHKTLYINKKVVFCSISIFTSTFKEWSDGIEVDSCCYCKCGPLLKSKLLGALKSIGVKRYEF